MRVFGESLCSLLEKTNPPRKSIPIPAQSLNGVYYYDTA